MKNILIIVDPQNDFISGSLAVQGAREAMNELAYDIPELINKFEIENILFTWDYHPDDHCSFDTFPPHCVEGTEGALLDETVDTTILMLDDDINVYDYFKGESADIEEFSFLSNSDNKEDFLDKFGNSELNVYICGIAGDYCVHDTILDLLTLDNVKSVNVLVDYCPSIDGGEKLNNLLTITGGVNTIRLTK